MAEFGISALRETAKGTVGCGLQKIVRIAAGEPVVMSFIDIDIRFQVMSVLNMSLDIPFCSTFRISPHVRAVVSKLVRWEF